MVVAIQKLAPLFTAPSVIDYEFEDLSLVDYRGKYVVLFFYPYDFSFVCPTEIISFSDRIDEFRSIGCEVLACSTDSVYTHLAFINQPREEGGLGEMNIPVISDFSKQISKDYGVYIDNEESEDNGTCLRGLFIIDPDGILRQMTINDIPVGRNVDEVLRLVKAFQFTDEHGEVCPANWNPGSATIKPTNQGAKDFFLASSGKNYGRRDSESDHEH